MIPKVSSDHKIRIVPVKDVGGSLSEFAKKHASTDFQEVRNQALEQSITEKFNKE